VLYSFKGFPEDGSNPDVESLTFDKHGNLYGTAALGGDLLDCDRLGCGVVFKLAPDGTQTILHNFRQSAGDGIFPFSGIVRTKNGTLYGATFAGGDHQAGAIYSVSSAGDERVIYSFTGGSDGGDPYGGLILDKHRNLYGTTQYGGASKNCTGGCGTIFKVAPNGIQTVLYSFSGGNDGFWPWAGLVSDKHGNFYGTTWMGGSGAGCGSGGCGTVFKLTSDGSHSVLHSLDLATGGSPWGGVIVDEGGNIYGTTAYGGSGTACGSPRCGTVFKIAPDGTYTVLHSFNWSDGAYPHGALLLHNGKLYGTTEWGGTSSHGSVFELTP
jgi:uncharacterized repeat protein (TIGR03803 family)